MDAPRDASGVLSETPIVLAIQDRFHNGFRNTAAGVSFDGRVRDSGYIYMENGLENGNVWTATVKLQDDSAAKICLGWLYPSNNVNGFSKTVSFNWVGNPVHDWNVTLQDYFNSSWLTPIYYTNYRE